MFNLNYLILRWSVFRTLRDQLISLSFRQNKDQNIFWSLFMAKKNTLYANHPFYIHNILLAIVSEINFFILQQNLVKKNEKLCFSYKNFLCNMWSCRSKFHDSRKCLKACHNKYKESLQACLCRNKDILEAWENARINFLKMFSNQQDFVQQAALNSVVIVRVLTSFHFNLSLICLASAFYRL